MKTDYRFSLILLLLFIAAGCFGEQAQAQSPPPIAGPNVNMLAGATWPNGDPFLQRQNEPSLAVSTRNPSHLMGGANDYRTVDLPGLNDKATADAWLGLFKSFDGGQTWQSTLLPGYPQDTSAQGLASPIKGFQAAADPTIRAGTNGLFYYSGMAFNRGTNGLGKVFVARFIDDNNKEAGDPIRYLGAASIDDGTAGQFLDKPWIAVDIPRPGALTCSIPGSTALPFPAGNVYLVFSKFTGNTSTKIVISRSRDCGQTWTAPSKLSEGNSINQGTAIAIDPVSGAVYVAWRRFKTNSQSDAIMIAKSTDFGQTFTKGVQVASISPFDQGTTGASFRTNAFPTMTVSVDGEGRSHVHVAWAERAGSGGDARIVMATSTDGTWSVPQLVDPNPNRGHQIMPSLTFAGGKLAVVFYDLRDDHTVGVYTPLGGGQYAETRVPAGTDAPSSVFSSYISDAGLKRRHTMDVRGALADAAATPLFSGSVRVSQYRFGSRPGSTVIEQLQVNPPNLPMFSKGTVPFMGDYLDLAAVPFLPVSGGGWRFNTRSSDPAVFHATWTDNRDVRPPRDGNWANYTPVGMQSGTVPSLYDPSQPTPACTPGQSASRNQNVYTSRLTLGLVVGSLGNDKPLGNLKRAFVVFVQNTSNQVRSYRLTIVQPAVGQASFAQFFPPIVGTLDVRVAARSSASRTVFVSSTDKNAQPTVNVAEITAPNGTLVVNGLQGTVVLNPDITNPDIANPDIANPDIANPDIANAEVYNPDIANPDIANPDIANPDIANPDIANPDIANPDIANPDIANPDIANPDIANPDIANPDIANPDIANPDIANGSLTDATWTMRNTGNTSASFSAKLFLKGNVVACVPGCGTGNQPACVPGCLKFQLLLHRRYQTPAAQLQCQSGACIPGCQLQLETQNVLVANVTNPTFTASNNLANPDIANPDIANATLALAPGESGQITLRVVDPNRHRPSDSGRNMAPSSFVQLTQDGGVRLLASSGADLTSGTIDLTSSVTSVVGAQGVNTQDEANGSTQPPVTLTVTTTALPDGIKGATYNQMLQAVGGVGLYTWSLGPSSQLPLGLTLGGFTGLISGIPANANLGNPFLVQVTDSPVPPNAQHTSTQNLGIRIGDPLVITTAALPDGVRGTFYQAVLNATGGIGTFNWSLASGSLPAGLTLSPSGILSGTPTQSGLSFTFTLAVKDGSCLTLPCPSPQVANVSLNLRIGEPLAITSALAPDGTLGVSYPGANFVATGGIGSRTWSITSGALPDGLALNPLTGAISGEVRAAGTFNFTVQVADSSCLTLSCSKQVATRSVSMPVVLPALVAAISAFQSGAPNDTVLKSGEFVTVKLTLSNGGADMVRAVTATALNVTGTALGGVCSAANPASADIPGGASLDYTYSCGPVSGNGTLVFNAGAGVTVNGVFTAVGATAASNTVSVDSAPPTLTASALAGGLVYNSGVWTNQDVKITFSCTDTAGGSGVATLSGPSTLTAEGANQAVTGTCTDVAGNSVSVTFGPTNIDKTLPVLTATALAGTVPYTPGTWTNRNVTVSFTCTDSGSGVANSSAPITLATEGANQSVPGACSDRAGNGAAITFGPVGIDKSPPMIVITAPMDGASLILNALVAASYSCADGLSGVAACSGPVLSGANIDTASVGFKYFGVSAMDGAGNLSRMVTRYQVKYTFVGFLTPLSTDGTPSGTANLGNALPIKWQLQDAVSAFISNLATLVSMKSVFNGPPPPSGVCPISPAGQEFLLYEPTKGAAGGSVFRYDPTGNQFIFNWDTSTAQTTGPGCYSLFVSLSDGTLRSTSILLR